MEYREFRGEPVGVSGEGSLYGVALPLKRETVIGDLKRGGWREEAAPGLCNKSIKDGDVVFLAHHDMHMPMARMSAGNLSLREEGDEIRWDANPVDTTYAQDIRKLADAKVLKGTSIGFNPVKDEWFDDEGNPSNRHVGTRRVLREIKLIEISAVTNPAYKDTSIMARDELLAEREARADREAEAPEETAPRELVEWYEDRASSIGADDRKALAAKGHALSDGSYPIPDKSHLHAAAVLAASHHGNWKAAKALIRKPAKALGVDVSSLPGFGKQDNEEPEVEADVRDDPDGKEYAAIDEALRQIKSGDVKGAEKTLAANQAARSQEPEASTPDDENDDALLARLTRAQESSRRLGLD